MSNIAFKKAPSCEACEQEPAIAFTFFHPGKRPHFSGWKFTGKCTNEKDDYAIEFDRFFADPTSIVRWLGHLNEKTWMNGNDFMAMMERFRDATESH